MVTVIIVTYISLEADKNFRGVLRTQSSLIGKMGMTSREMRNMGGRTSLMRREVQFCTAHGELSLQVTMELGPDWAAAQLRGCCRELHLPCVKRASWVRGALGAQPCRPWLSLRQAFLSML